MPSNEFREITTPAHRDEELRGGTIPLAEQVAYKTHRDRASRTNAGVLVANYPVKSYLSKEYHENNGWKTANVDIVYRLQDVPVLTRKCQINMPPDKSEATIVSYEWFLRML
jgi:hypothetical protein